MKRTIALAAALLLGAATAALADHDHHGSSGGGGAGGGLSSGGTSGGSHGSHGGTSAGSMSTGGMTSGGHHNHHVSGSGGMSTGGMSTGGMGTMGGGSYGHHHGSGVTVGLGVTGAHGSFHPVPPNGSRYWHRGSWFNRVHAHPFNYPQGWGYRTWMVGQFLPALFLTPDYYWTDYAAFDLQPPPPGYQWIRYGDDLLLVNLRTGAVEDVIQGAFEDD